jgi:hypothetical protein
MEKPWNSWQQAHELSSERSSHGVESPKIHMEKPLIDSLAVSFIRDLEEVANSYGETMDSLAVARSPGEPNPS